MTTLTINFMSGEKITMKKPTDFGEIKCEIFRERKIMDERYALFKIGEEEELTTYDNEDILFCMISIMKLNKKYCVGDVYIKIDGLARNIDVFRVIKRTKCFITFKEHQYTRCEKINDQMIFKELRIKDPVRKKVFEYPLRCIEYTKANGRVYDTSADYAQFLKIVDVKKDIRDLFKEVKREITIDNIIFKTLDNQLITYDYE